MRLRIVLPVGISFYVFKTMSYTIDVYRRTQRAEHDLLHRLSVDSHGALHRGQPFAGERRDEAIGAAGLLEQADDHQVIR